MIAVAEQQQQQQQVGKLSVPPSNATLTATR